MSVTADRFIPVATFRTSALQLLEKSRGTGPTRYFCEFRKKPLRPEKTVSKSRFLGKSKRRGEARRKTVRCRPRLGREEGGDRERTGRCRKGMYVCLLFSSAPTRTARTLICLQGDLARQILLGALFATGSWFDAGRTCALLTKDTEGSVRSTR